MGQEKNHDVDPVGEGSDRQNTSGNNQDEGEIAVSSTTKHSNLSGRRHRQRQGGKGTTTRTKSKNAGMDADGADSAKKRVSKTTFRDQRAIREEIQNDFTSIYQDPNAIVEQSEQKPGAHRVGGGSDDEDNTSTSNTTGDPPQDPTEGIGITISPASAETVPTASNTSERVSSSNMGDEEQGNGTPILTARLVEDEDDASNPIIVEAKVFNRKKAILGVLCLLVTGIAIAVGVTVGVQPTPDPETVEVTQSPTISPSTTPTTSISPSMSPTTLENAALPVLLEFFGLNANQLLGTDRLVVSNQRLIGEIPSEIGILTGLTFLGLSDNALINAVPSEIGMLTSLRILSLDTNELTSIPSMAINYHPSHLSLEC